MKTENLTNDLKKVAVWLIGGVVTILFWYAEKDREKLDFNVNELYDIGDQAKDLQIKHLKGESFYWRDMYLNCNQNEK